MVEVTEEMLRGEREEVGEEDMRGEEMATAPRLEPLVRVGREGSKSVLDLEERLVRGEGREEEGGERAEGMGAVEDFEGASGGTAVGGGVVLFMIPDWLLPDKFIEDWLIPDWLVVGPPLLKFEVMEEMGVLASLSLSCCPQKVSF